MEWRPELYCPVWGGFTGAQPGLLTNENKKSFELYWYLQLKTNKQNGKKESQTISVNWDEGETWLFRFTVIQVYGEEKEKRK